MTTTRDFAAKFGRHPDMGMEGQKSFPFIYTLINRQNSQWRPQTDVALATQAGAVANIVNGIGPLVPANSKINFNVMLDPNYIFKLLSIKYCVYYAYEIPPNGAPGHFGDYEWYENINNAPIYSESDGIDPDALKLQDKIKAQGVEKTLKDVSGVDPRSDLGNAIVKSYTELKIKLKEWRG